MPTSLEAALVFSILIVPGYLLLRGYYVGRAHTLPERDLHLLAQAVVASLIWLAVTWLVVEDLLGWIENDELDRHQLEGYGIGALIVVAPYLLGRFAGFTVAQAGRLEASRASIARAYRWMIFRAVAAIEHPTAWERAWAGRSQAWIVVVLDDERVIQGQFATRSKVDVSPKKPQLYLEETYEVREDGSILEQGSMHIDGGRIVSVEFL